MKKIGIAAMVLLSFIGFTSKASAGNFDNNFKANLNSKSLNALALDLGSLVGGASFHTGKNLGFIPIGFDVGVHVPVVGVSNDDVILRDDASQIAAAWGQGELGLPLNLGLIVRGGKVESATMVGGGLRWTIFDMKGPLLPALSVEGLYGRMTQTYFNMNTYTGNAVLSFNVPFVHPYVGAGYDYSQLDPTSQALEGFSDQSVKGEAHGNRVEVGLNISIIPFTYITVGAGVTHGEKLYHGGLGINF